MLHRDPCRLVSLTVILLAVCLAGSSAIASDQATAEAKPPSGLLTLQDCVRIALDSSANMRIREAEREVAEETVTESWGAFLPDFSLTGSYTKSDRTDFDSTSPIYGVDQFGLETVSGDSVYIPYDSVIGSRTSDVTVSATSKNWGASLNMTVFDGLATFVKRFGFLNALLFFTKNFCINNSI